jgi:hypothetical protein
MNDELRRIWKDAVVGLEELPRKSRIVERSITA